MLHGYSRFVAGSLPNCVLKPTRAGILHMVLEMGSKGQPYFFKWYILIPMTLPFQRYYLETQMPIEVTSNFSPKLKVAINMTPELK